MSKKPLEWLPAGLLLLAPCALAIAQETLPVDENIYEMSPFVVSSTEDVGYVATSTLAGTRIKTDLRDVGSAISVVTQKFLEDTNATNNESLLVYTTNTEVAGLSGNFSGFSSIGASLDPYPLMLRPQQNTRVRGLSAADNTRNFFLTEVPWDSYNVERVDLQRGPNAILFGMGSPAGIINNSTNLAYFNESRELKTSFDRWGSYRVTLGANQEILEKQLAVRVDVLHDHRKYEQKPAFNKDQRIYAAMRWDPSFLNKKGFNTTFRANYEKGEIDANRPRMLPLVDKFTPWFTELNQQGYDPKLAWNYVPGVPSAQVQSSVEGAVNPHYTPWLGQPNAGAQRGIRAIFDDPRSAEYYYQYAGFQNRLGIGPDGAIDGSIGGIPYSEFVAIRGFGEYANHAKLPLYQYGQYKDKMITDRSIYDYRKVLIDGPNKYEKQEFDNYNISLAQTALNNKVGLEVVFDHQKYEDEQASLMGNSQALEIDINENMHDGTPNPNFGRPYIGTRANFNNRGSLIERDALRVTAFGELNVTDLMKKETFLSKLLGRHVFTGLYADETNKSDRRDWARVSADEEFSMGLRPETDGLEQVVFMNYMGPSLVGRPYTDARVSGIKVKQKLGNGPISIWDSNWNAPDVDPAAPWTDPSVYNWEGTESTQSENPANYVGWTTRNMNLIQGDDLEQRKRIYRGGTLAKSETTSKALVWQGYFWDGMVVPMIGWREDENKSYSFRAPEKANRTRNLDSSVYKLPEEPNAIVKDESLSWSLVIHTPRSVQARMPGQTGLSFFYNKSKNFQPLAGRFNVYGEEIAPPQGETEDFGFIISTWNNKLTLKVNRYETLVTNDSAGGISTWQLMAAEAWGEIYAMQAKNFWGGFNNGYPINQVGQTLEQAEAIRSAAVAAWESNRSDPRFDAFFEIDRSKWQSWINWGGGNGFTVTGDSKSKGTEFELNFNPTRSFSITANASKTEAKVSNLDQTFSNYVDERLAHYNGPAGDIRIWWAGSTETIKTWMDSNFNSGYRLWKLQEGTNKNELRKWRYNLVANYTFHEGVLQGLNIGGSYRWQDKVSIGYPLAKTGEQDLKGNDIYDFDLDRPYWGPSEDAVDMWVGYSRKLTDKIDWRIQLNVRDVFADEKLVPISVQPDGSPAAFRVKDTTNITLSNSFKF